MPDDTALAELYGREEYFTRDLVELHDDLRDGYDPDVPIVSLYRRHLDRIARHVRPPARLLEVGCARGVFAHLAAGRGYDVRVTDRNPYGVAYARERFGIVGAAGRFEDADVGGPYDVIATFDVIEHVPDPAAFMARASALLAPGGIVAVGTPDAGSPLLVAAELAARVTGGRWRHPLWRVYGGGREHLHLFTRAGLASLARDAGLAPVDAYGYAIPFANMRETSPAYRLLLRAALRVPYETVMIAKKNDPAT